MIKGKPGNMSNGSTKETLDGISRNYFTKLSENLLKGKFNFTPTRRIMIHKGQGKVSQRTLSIANPKEKIVKKALDLVLEMIYEPILMENSHEELFKSTSPKDVHSALKQLHIKRGTFTWVIKGDISKCFDKIQNDKILNLLGKRISCHRTLELIQKSLVNPAIKDQSIIPSHKETQHFASTREEGSIISPIWSNIVLHEFDLFCNKLKQNFDKGSTRRIKPKYNSLGPISYKTNKIKNAIFKSENLKKMISIAARDTQDPNFRRLIFVRYADDFVVLLISSITDAYTIRRKIRDFLKNHLGLDLNVNKTTINNIKDGFNFLDAFIKQRGSIISKEVRNTSSNFSLNSKVVRKRHIRRLSILAPLDNIILKLIKLGFARRNHLGQLLPKSRRDLVNFTHYEIISFYNSRIRATLKFYSFAGNYDKLKKI
jgi:retron-type reverse transcriptase